MSTATQNAMIDAIAEHFRDEGLVIDEVNGVLVRLLIASEDSGAHPARYLWAPECATSAALTNSAAFDGAWVAKSYGQGAQSRAAKECNQ